MAIGVFHGNGVFYTCCCRTVIRDLEDNCPQCGRPVILPKDRPRTTYGAEHEAKKARWKSKFIESGRYKTGIVAARLTNTHYAMPQLCIDCGEPEQEDGEPSCRCLQIYPFY